MFDLPTEFWRFKFGASKFPARVSNLIAADFDQGEVTPCRRDQKL
jgi:hypothetical protein